MRDERKQFLKRFPVRCAAAGLIACGLFAGAALAAEYEVRLPVEKTVRLTPLGETPDPDAKPAKTPAKKPAAAEKPAPADKTAAPEKPAAAEKPAKPKAAEAAPKAPRPAAAKKTPKPAPDQANETAAAEAAPAAVEQPPAPRISKAPKPAPEPKLDPKASVLPQTQEAPQKPAVLPADGLWVGDLSVEFQEDRVVLRAAANSQAERVTWFNQAEPRKLAVDLRGAWRKKGPMVLRYDTGPVKSVVVGEHPDRLRLAVEFRDGAVAPVVQPSLENTPQGLSVTIPLAVRLAR